MKHYKASRYSKTIYLHKPNLKKVVQVNGINEYASIEETSKIFKRYKEYGFILKRAYYRDGYVLYIAEKCQSLKDQQCTGDCDNCKYCVGTGRFTGLGGEEYMRCSLYD